ncbi:MAG: AMP-binding protein [Microbacterium sp.]|uniref:AMP-binding protein n=1 Tax=Microbacterium sp. TaxID=51671 RepID=UPI001DC498C9|nr:AMP-binding protein [Microbacterium sp.]MBW8764559.1 AMP-binding protein [Microbacterium sp.]
MTSQHLELTSFWRYADSRPGAVAVIAPDGTATTYAELRDRSNRIANALRAAGLVTGDRVALVARNGVGFLAWALGAGQVGISVVPVNHHLTPSEAAYILSDSGARRVVLDPKLADLGNAAMDEAGIPAGHRVWVDEQIPASHEPPTARVFGAMMLYTSGTTGRPKGVLWPNAGLEPEAFQQYVDPIMARRGMAHDPGAVSLVSGPLYHGAPGAWALQGLHHGHTVLLMDRWDSELFLRLVQQHRVRTAQLAPIHFHRLLSLGDDVRSSYDVSSLRVVSHAGAATPVNVKHRMMAWFGPTLHEYYASSEGYGTSIGPEEWLAHPGSVGRADGDGAEMRIRDEEGTDLPTGEVGTLWVRNPGGAVSSYLNAPEKTAASHSTDGFYTVGDLGYLDDDGYLYLVDRRDDLILSGGVNVYPAEVEQALARHAGVREVVVVGVPDQEWGQAVHAVIVPVDASAGPELIDDVLAFVREHLAGFKVPRTMELRDRLPYTESGKLLRRALRDELSTP